MVMQDDTAGDDIEGGAGVATASVAETKAPVEITAERAALVKEWLTKIKSAEAHWEKKAFKRMRTCMQLAADGTVSVTAAEGEGEGTQYVVPIANRLVNMAVASLYAKNPTAVAKRKAKLMYKLWDGDPASIQQAMLAMQNPQPVPVTDQMGQPVVDPATGQPAVQLQPDPAAVALLTELQQVKQQIILEDRMAKTMKLLFAYFLEEQDCGYKEQFKALVRRAKVCGVGYVDLDFQRQLKQNPDIAAKLADITSQIDAIEAGTAKATAGELEEGTAGVEELRLLMQDLQQKVDVVVREGPLLSFSRATDIIPDEDCRHLKTFAGSRWVARRYDLTVDRIKEVYKVDVEGNATPYENGKARTGKDGKKNSLCRVYRVQDKRNQQVFVVCDGYKDFIVEPAEPDVKIERFWTTFPLVFNEVESDDDKVSIFPPSDVWNARHMQREYNSSRQGLREHKKAARPRWATNGQMEQADKDKLKNSEPFEIIEMMSLAAGSDITKILSVIPVPGVDPNLYETDSTFRDIERVVGAQQANFGATGGDTATESSIAENSRQSGVGSDVDDLDTLLTALARAMGQLMLLEMSKDMVIEICGPGAVWPDAPPTREQIVKDLILEVEAGSSGRPNKAADLANYERVMPWVQVLPGMNPVPWIKKAADLFDIDIEEAYVEGMPSIAAMNQMAGRNQHAGGDPQADPNQQGDKGGQGGDQQGSTQHNEPQAQPAHPAPMAQPGPGAPVA